MNAVTKVEPKLMLLDGMAAKAGLRPQEFADTVRKTCGLATASNEEFAAFLLVAREYQLNPLLREVYAFPKKGGGIVPIVSIDGWINLVNSQPQCDGFDFNVEHEPASGALVSMTCHMYRKDRARPVVVTEYLAECRRDTEAWKMAHRMLRHKALIQAARYAFGFSGIYDEDEAVKIAEMRDITPAQPSRPVAPRPPDEQVSFAPSPTYGARNLHDGAKADRTITEAVEAEPVQLGEQEPEPAAEDYDPTPILDRIEDTLAAAESADQIEEFWSELDVEAELTAHPDDLSIANAIRVRHLKRVRG